MLVPHRYGLHLSGISWEANRSSATQETLRILWNPKVHYRIHKSPPLVPILSHIDSVHASPHHFLDIHFNNISQSILGLPRGLFFLRYLRQNPVRTCSVSHTFHVPSPSHYSWFDRPNNGFGSTTLYIDMRRCLTVRDSRCSGFRPVVTIHSNNVFDLLWMFSYESG